MEIIFKQLERLCIIILVALVILCFWQVFSRYGLNNPSTFTEELLRSFLVWMVMLGSALAFKTREHLALVFIFEKLSPKAGKKLRIINDCIVLFFTLFVMVYGGYDLIVSAGSQKTAILGIPMSWVYSCVFISGLLVTLIQIQHILVTIKSQPDNSSTADTSVAN
ncbi:TRAP transporter small permease [Vibrio mediterranei]|uniref:TRAP transporter small permease n=1 Tax=Vibrio mediterranei TaxID=689 RepID=UPI0022848969|nr:TRAP transporter small permease [Vibrio mediterranei]MCY9852058.1 TRAP transporter small permease [Vibrio mediterranei]